MFYRLWLVDGIYQNNLNKPFGGNGYRGDFAIFLPFSRRFELFLNVPFVAANGTEDPNRGYRSDFGDMPIAAGFLLSESESFTQLATLGMIVPTGQTETGGNLMTLFPRYSFWSNPGGAWVVRGGLGFNVPLNKNDQQPAPVFTPDGGVLFGESTSQTTYNAALAVGRYFTPHDVPFGDLVLYANCNVVVPLEDRQSADLRRGRPRHAVPDHRQLVVPALLGVPAGGRQAVRLPDVDGHREGVLIPGMRSQRSEKQRTWPSPAVPIARPATRRRGRRRGPSRRRGRRGTDGPGFPGGDLRGRGWPCRRGSSRR